MRHISIKLLLVIILLFLINCEKNYETIQIPGVVSMGLAERFTPESQKIFSLRLVVDQNCHCTKGNFRYRYQKFGNSLYFDLLGLELPDGCNEKYGSPYAEINLGSLTNGVYSIKINSKTHSSMAFLTITDTAFNVSMEKSYNIRLMWGHFRRVFDNTLWGGFSYNTDSELSKGLSFIDSLNALGVKPSTLENGDYMFFLKQSEKIDLKMWQYVPHSYMKEIGFVYNYDFNDQKIINLINKFKFRDGNLYIKIATGKGANLYNWK